VLLYFVINQSNLKMLLRHRKPFLAHVQDFSFPIVFLFFSEIWIKCEFGAIEKHFRLFQISSQFFRELFGLI